MGTPADPTPSRVPFAIAAAPYFEGIRRYCISRAGTFQRGEDIAQDALMKAFKSWDSFVDIGYGPGPWLYKIAKRELVSAGIKQTELDKKHQFAYEDEEGNVDYGFDEYDFNNAADSPEMLIIEKFGMADIEAAINALDEEFREVAFQKFATVRACRIRRAPSSSSVCDYKKLIPTPHVFVSFRVTPFLARVFRTFCLSFT